MNSSSATKVSQDRLGLSNELRTEAVDLPLTFPAQLNHLRDRVFAQAGKLCKTAARFADALQHGDLVHVYANGHSRISVEELVVRMGALSGFHPIMASALSNFTDVVGINSLRLCQTLERIEGLGGVLLDDLVVHQHDVFLVISATGQTPAAVDFALEVSIRYPGNPLIVIASLEQAKNAPPKHSCGKTLYHVVNEHRDGCFLDNCMPLGDLTTTIEGRTGRYQICPISSLGAITLIQSLNELTLRELDRRGCSAIVLQNMHLGQTQTNYEEWLADQCRRYARSLYSPDSIRPAQPGGASAKDILDS